MSNIVCSPCLRDGRSVDPVKFCADCMENLCKPCLRSHLKSGVYRKHKIIGRDDVPDWMCSRKDEGQEDIIFDQCPKHQHIVAEHFCHVHNVTCCSECLETDHGPCDTIGIMKAASESDFTVDCMAAIKELETEIGELNELEDTMIIDRSKSRQSTAESLKRIRQFRETISKHFDILEKKAIDEVNTHCLNQEAKIETDVATVGSMKFALQQHLKNVKRETETETEKLAMFLHRCKFRTEMDTVVQLKANLEENRQTSEAKDKILMLNPKVDLVMREIKSLGHLTARVDQLSIELESDVDLASAGIIHHSDIQSIAGLRSGKRVLVNFNSKCIIVLERDCKIELVYEITNLDKTECRGGPYSVCSTNGEQVAVSVTEEKLVQLVTVNKGMSLDSVIPIDEYCRGVCYSCLYDELYVACGGGSYSGEGLAAINTYTLSGEHIRTITINSLGRRIIQFPQHMVINQHGSKLLIYDGSRGVFLIDRQGRELWSHPVDKLDRVTGLCVDADDNIIVSGNGSIEIMQISKDGEKTFDLLSCERSGSAPSGLWYDNVTGKIIVCMEGSSVIRIYNVTRK